MRSGSEEIVAIFHGPVWPTLPQTPQAAEQMAIIAPAFVIRQPVQVHSDCLGVVRLHNQSPSQ
eukprot:2861129-Pyramimonas_sp.AAC.1